MNVFSIRAGLFTIRGHRRLGFHSLDDDTFGVAGANWRGTGVCCWGWCWGWGCWGREGRARNSERGGGTVEVAAAERRRKRMSVKF